MHRKLFLVMRISTIFLILWNSSGLLVAWF